jgi:hypothetical protein
MKHRTPRRHTWPTHHAVQLRNIGRGPAIRTRVFHWASGALFWNSGPGFPLAAGETFPPPPTVAYLPLIASEVRRPYPTFPAASDGWLIMICGPSAWTSSETRFCST